MPPRSTTPPANPNSAMNTDLRNRTRDFELELKARGLKQMLIKDADWEYERDLPAAQMAERSKEQQLAAARARLAQLKKQVAIEIKDPIGILQAKGGDSEAALAPIKERQELLEKRAAELDGLWDRLKNKEVNLRAEIRKDLEPAMELELMQRTKKSRDELTREWATLAAEKLAYKETIEKNYTDRESSLGRKESAVAEREHQAEVHARLNRTISETLIKGQTELETMKADYRKQVDKDFSERTRALSSREEKLESDEQEFGKKVEECQSKFEEERVKLNEREGKLKNNEHKLKEDADALDQDKKRFEHREGKLYEAEKKLEHSKKALQEAEKKFKRDEDKFKEREE